MFEKDEIEILLGVTVLVGCNGAGKSTRCFDVRRGEHVSFTDYEDFRAFIMASREAKDARERSGESHG